MVYWQPGQFYFLTTSTFLHYPYFEKPDQKQIVLDKINQVKEDLNMTCAGYSIAASHYHSMFQPDSSQNFSRAKQIINGGTSYEYRKLYPDRIKKKYFWSNVKSLKIYSEEIYWRVIGYIIGNLLKHREVKNFEELRNSPFSSFKEIVYEYGLDFAKELVLSVIEVPEMEGLPEMESLEKCKIPKTKEELKFLNRS